MTISIVELDKMCRVYFEDMKNRNIIASCWKYRSSHCYNDSDINDKIRIIYEREFVDLKQIGGAQSLQIKVSDILSFSRDKKINSILDI